MWTFTQGRQSRPTRGKARKSTAEELAQPQPRRDHGRNWLQHSAHGSPVAGSPGIVTPWEKRAGKAFHRKKGVADFAEKLIASSKAR